MAVVRRSLRLPLAALILTLGLGVSGRSTLEEDADLLGGSAAPTLMKRCVAEALGTGIIVHMGCGVVCVDRFANAQVGTFGICSVWIACVLIAIYATRDISGAHLNPAVSVSLVIYKDFPLLELVPFVASQVFGAFVGAAANYGCTAHGISQYEAVHRRARGTTPSTFVGAFACGVTPEILSPISGFLVEVWATAWFVFLIFALGDPNCSVPTAASPVLTGIVVGGLVSVFGPLTCCCINPARDLGPRLVVFAAGFGRVAWTQWWIYAFGPPLGAVLGGALYTYCYKFPVPTNGGVLLSRVV